MKYALLSVSDKTNIVSFARSLQDLGWHIISTGGTKKLLESEGISIVPIESVTGNPECFDGRMKSISFQIEGGILYDRMNALHVSQAQDLGVKDIGLVCCNLYPFRETIRKEGVTLQEAIENIDVGGPTMVRSAAKNFKSVIVATDPEDYSDIIRELKDGGVSAERRGILAVKAFDLMADYDAAIDIYLAEHLKGEHKVRLKFEDGKKLRYGENDHQTANIFVDTRVTESNIPQAKQLAGKELSFNNYIDANSALEAIKPLADQYAVCIVKHNNPCGYATGETLRGALEAAWQGDPVSAFGSVIALTQEVDLEVAEYLKGKFVEILIAPSFTADAISYLTTKNIDLRLLQVSELDNGKMRRRTYKHLIGGLLEQDRDLESFSKWECVTQHDLPEEKRLLAEFSYLSVKFIKSNAVVLSEEYAPGFFRTIAIGAGQPNRINAVRHLAIPKAIENFKTLGYNEEEARKKLGELVFSSDAFFPFRDTVDCAGEFGIKYIIQPGGSKRDQESIDACNEHGIAMIFTGTRHFNH